MIPIAVFIIIWLALVGIFIIIASLSILQMLRYGISGPVTKWATVAFAGISVAIILSTLVFLSNEDLQIGFNVSGILKAIFPNSIL